MLLLDELLAQFFFNPSSVIKSEIARITDPLMSGSDCVSIESSKFVVVKIIQLTGMLLRFFPGATRKLNLYI